MPNGCKICATTVIEYFLISFSFLCFWISKCKVLKNQRSLYVQVLFDTNVCVFVDKDVSFSRLYFSFSLTHKAYKAIKLLKGKKWPYLSDDVWLLWDRNIHVGLITPADDGAEASAGLYEGQKPWLITNTTR